MHLCVISYDGRLKGKYILGCPLWLKQWVFAHYGDLIWTSQFFSIFLRCKKINKLRSTEIFFQKDSFI
jgi:hypothetical protein